MEPIRPIGPRELDIEPVVNVPRSSRDGGRDRPDPREGERREQRPRPEPEAQPLPPLHPGEDGPSLIDIRV